MGNHLDPGGMGDKSDAGKPDDFTGGMAEAMENALWNLLHNDGMNTFDTDTNSQEARDRRRLFVAIAQGIVSHLVNNAGAFQVTFVDAGGNTITASVAISYNKNTQLTGL